MPRYYFHLHDGAELLVDHEGADLPNIGAVIRSALEQARSLLSADVTVGALDLRLFIEVTDGNGAVVHALQFQDALTISWPSRDTSAIALIAPDTSLRGDPA